MIRPFLLSFACLAVIAAPAVAAEPVDYRKDVQPILAQHCYECHGPDTQKSGLRLDTGAAAQEGGYNGPALIAGKSGESPLIAAVTGAGDVEKMPPERPPLSDAQSTSGGPAPGAPSAGLVVTTGTKPARDVIAASSRYNE